MPSASVSVASTLIQGVLVVLPFWLVAIRYVNNLLDPNHPEGSDLIPERNREESQDKFVMFICLTYFSLIAVLVFSVQAIDPVVSLNVKIALRGLELGILSIGLMLYTPIKQGAKSWSSRAISILFWAFGWLVLVGSFIQLVSYGLK